MTRHSARTTSVAVPHHHGSLQSRLNLSSLLTDVMLEFAMDGIWMVGRCSVVKHE